MSKITAANNSKKKEEEKKQQTAPKATQNTTQPKVESKRIETNVVKPGATKYDSLTNHNRVQEHKDTILGPSQPKTPTELLNNIKSDAKSLISTPKQEKKNVTLSDVVKGTKDYIKENPIPKKDTSSKQTTQTEQKKESKVSQAISKVTERIPTLEDIDESKFGVYSPLVGGAKKVAKGVGDYTRANLEDLLPRYFDNGFDTDFSNLTDEQVVRKYESLPKSDVFSRYYSKDSEQKRRDYAERQALSDRYKQIKANEHVATLKNNGLTDEDLYNYGGGLFAFGKNVRENGLDEIPSLLSNAFETRKAMKEAGLSNKEIDNALLSYKNQAQQDFGNRNKNLASGAAVVTNAFESIGNLGKNIWNVASGNPIESNHSLSENLREGVSRDWGNGGKFLYGVANSIGDMGVAMGLAAATGGGSLVSSGIMGTEKASQVMNEAEERGLQPGEILMETAASGLTTALTEMIPMGKFEELASKGLSGAKGMQLAKEIATKVVSGAFPEMVQEMSEDVADMLADRLLVGDKSKIDTDIRELEAQGYNEKTAKVLAWASWVHEVCTDGVAGLLSGGAMAGGSAIGGGLSGNIDTEYDPNALRDFLFRGDAIQNLLAQYGVNEEQNIPTMEQNVEQANPVEQLQNLIPQSNISSMSSANVQNTQNTNTQSFDFEDYGYTKEEVLSTISEAINLADENGNGELGDRLLEVIGILNEENNTSAFKDYGYTKEEILSTLSDAINVADETNNGALGDRILEIVGMINDSENNNAPQETNTLRFEDYGYTKDEALSTLSEAVNLADQTNNSEFGDRLTETIGMINDIAEGTISSPEEYGYSKDDVLNTLSEAINLADANNAGELGDRIMEVAGILSDMGESTPTDIAESVGNLDANISGMPTQTQAQIPTMAQNATAQTQGYNKNNLPNIGLPSQNLQANNLQAQTPTTNNVGVSQSVTNTMSGLNFVNETKAGMDHMAEYANSEKAKYDKQTEEANMNEAVDRYTKDPQGSFNELVNKESWNKASDIDLGMIHYNQLWNQALQTGDFSKADAFATLFHSKVRDAARVLQAMAKYTRDPASLAAKVSQMRSVKANNANQQTKNAANKIAERVTNVRLDNIFNSFNQQTGQPETVSQPKSFEQLRTEVENSIHNYEKNNENAVARQFTDEDITYITNMLANGIDSKFLAQKILERVETGYWGYDPADMQRINEIYEQIRNNPNPNSKEVADLENEAFSIMAEYLGDSTFMEKWNAWRYLAMLGNPRTMIRNNIGNFMFGMTTNVKDAIGAALESAIIRDGERTKAVVSRATDGSLMDATADDFDNSVYRLADESYKYNVTRGIEAQKKVFDSKLLNKYNDLVNGKLSGDDIKAMKRKYTRALAGYLKANGYNEDIFLAEQQGNKGAHDILAKARDYALNEAKVATFHEDSAIADTLSRWSREAAQSDNVALKGLSVLLESVMPFKKTPINILKQGAIEYNPVTPIIKSLKRAVTHENANPTQVIDEYAKGLTGAGIMALGMALAKAGVLRGGDEGDDILDEQSYSINIGNKSYSIDWLAPSALPLFMGVEVYKWLSNSEDTSLADALTSISEPVIEMSMLQGFQNTLNTIGRTYQANMAAKNSPDGHRQSYTGAILGSLGTGYLSQGIPTILGQVARGIDDTRRDSYTGAPSGGFKDTILRQGRKTLAKIPGLSTLDEPYVNAWGEEEKNLGYDDMIADTLGIDNEEIPKLLDVAGRLAYNMTSPGYYSNTERDAETAEIERLMNDPEVVKEVGDIYPDKAVKTYDGERLAPKDYTEFATNTGTLTREGVSTLINRSAYEDLSDTDKALAIKEMEKAAAAFAKADLGYDIEDSTTYSKYWNAYQNGGMKEVSKLILDETAYKSAIKEAGLGSNSKVREIYENEGIKGVNQYGKAMSKAESYGTDRITTDEWEAYKSGDKETFNNMVQARAMLEKADLPSSEATQEYIEKFGKEGIANLKEANDIVSTIQVGTDEYGKPKYQTLNSTMLDIYDKDGIEGLKNYKSAVEEAHQYGADNITTEEWKTYRAGNTQEFNELVKYRKILEDNDLNNTALNRGYVQEYGEDIIPVLQDASEAISQIEKGVDKYGDAQYFSPNEKMIEIYRQNGKDGVELYADLYTKGDIDDDPTKRSLHDTIPYLSSMGGMSDAEKGYYLSYFVSGKTVNKYLANNDYAGLYQYYLKKYAKDVKKYG